MADATTPETGTETTAETATTEAETTEQTETDWKAEAEKWKTQSRKNEDRAKDLDELHKASMSDSERAIAEAREAGKSEALTSVGIRLVDAEFRVAAAGTTLEVDDDFLDGLDRSKFLTDDGEPDADAIKAWVDRIAPAQTENSEPEEGPLGSGIDLGQGTRTTTDSNMALNGDPLYQALKNAVGA